MDIRDNIPIVATICVLVVAPVLMLAKWGASYTFYGFVELWPQTMFILGGLGLLFLMLICETRSKRRLRSSIRWGTSIVVLLLSGCAEAY
jgi:ATP/ADP translocase